MGSRYINERDRTLYGVNFDLLDGLTLSENGFPVMEPVKELPKVDEFIEFNRVLTFKGRPGNTGVHFYIDDYQFERVWNRPWEWVERLKQFKCVIQTQFSSYADFPTPLKWYQCYRNQLMGAFWQKQGITVIPGPGFPSEDTWDIFLEGVPEGGWLATGTVGVVRYADARVRFVRGLRNLIDSKHPNGLLIYGVVTPEAKTMLDREGIQWMQIRQGQSIRAEKFLNKRRK